MAEAMDDRVKGLFLIFKDALQDEQEAQAKYKKAAQLSDDKELKEVFESLYRDELRHENVLLRRYKVFRKKFNIAD